MLSAPQLSATMVHQNLCRTQPLLYAHAAAECELRRHCIRLRQGVLLCVHMEVSVPAIKVGVREFREQIARFLESDTPVAVTRRGETLGVYVPTPRKSVRSADMTELRAAADRLAAALSDVDEEEIVAEFKQTRRAKKAAGR
jgi:hypothetical protein